MLEKDLEVIGMGKWKCRCGQLMNDHNAPDRNYYRVFADVEWDAIVTDPDGNLNYYDDIPDPTYDVYKCPACGRLMVFGDDNRFKSYCLENDT